MAIAILMVIADASFTLSGSLRRPDDAADAAPGYP